MKKTKSEIEDEASAILEDLYPGVAEQKVIE